MTGLAPGQRDDVMRSPQFGSADVIKEAETGLKEFNLFVSSAGTLDFSMLRHRVRNATFSHKRTALMLPVYGYRQGISRLQCDTVYQAIHVSGQKLMRGPWKFGCCL